MPKPPPRPWKEIGRYGSVGIELILSVCIGFFGGRYLDGRWGTKWITWAGLALGMYAGFRALFKTAKQMQREIDKEDREHPHRFIDHTPDDGDWDDDP